jgi:multidrug efflux system outer membrane protein
MLAEWVERALAGAPDIAIARERVAQAEALLRVASAQRQPTLGAQAGADYNTRPTGGRQSRGRATALLQLDWDADLWGGLRQAERSAAASFLRSQDLVQAARLSIAGLAARAVIEYRAAVRDAQLLSQGHALQQDVLRVVRLRVDAGISPRLDRERALADLAAIEAEQAAAAGRMREAYAAMQLLAGDRPMPPSLQAVSSIVSDPVLQPSAGVPALVSDQPVGRPLDLLRQRPDLRAAERALEAAAADIGVARATLRPQLRLPSSVLLTSGSLGAIVLDTVTASIAAVFEMTLFDGGERRAQVDAAEATAREAALVYRQTLLQALNQVETALVGADAAAARIEALGRSAHAAEAALQDARTLYTAGLSTFLDVLEARRTSLAVHREQLQAQADAARLAVAAFESMGLVPPAADVANP